MGSATGSGWRRVGVGVAVLAVCALASLVPGPGASADVVVNPFAGNWTTFGGTGRLHLQVVDATTGQSAVAFYSGGSASCGSPTVYYGNGTYSSNNGGDVGRLAGCTDSTGRHLMAWYKSDIGPQNGTFTVGAGTGDTTFSGTYHENSGGGSSGTYDGMFIGDFSGSG